MGALVDLISQRRAQIDRLESESPLPAKVTAMEKLSDQYHVIVKIGISIEARLTRSLSERLNPTAAL